MANSLEAETGMLEVDATISLTSAHYDVESTPQHQQTYQMVSSRHLLALYLIIPAILLIVASDYIFFGNEMREDLPYTPYAWAGWALLIGYPHVIASFITFGVPGHVRQHKVNILQGLAVSFALAIAVPAIAGLEIGLLLVLSYSVYHGLVQQFGISLAFLKQAPDNDFKCWKWLNITAIWLVMLSWYEMNGLFFEDSFMLEEASWVLVGLATLYSIRIFAKHAAKQPANASGRYFFIANSLLVPACILLWQLNYPIFVMALIYLIHDLTAYMVYMAHSHNAEREREDNVLLRPFTTVGVPAAASLIVLSVLLAAPLTFHQDDALIILQIGLFLKTMHYYLESKMWKKDAPHREFVKFD